MNIISIKDYAIADPDGFYTQRWERGFMVYHGRLNWFSTSINEAKCKLAEIKKSIKGMGLISESFKSVYGDCLGQKSEYSFFPLCLGETVLDCDRFSFEQIYPINPNAYEYAKRRAANLMFEGFKISWLRPDIDPYFAELIADMVIAQRNAMYLPKEAFKNESSI